MVRRILVVGASGQLGRELCRSPWPDGVEVTGLTSSDLDITEPAGVTLAVSRIDPTVIVNAAAFTGVDAAEDDPQRATAVNGTAVSHLASAANLVQAMLIHLSTDYVFDGTKPGWYVESDQPVPLGVYGRSKLIGERAAAGARQSIVLRTSWVYGALGSNFVTTMLRMASETEEIAVVGDQSGCPTATTDLAAAIVEIVRLAGDQTETIPVRRLYHLASPESASRHEFAAAILKTSKLGFDGVCQKIATDDYQTRALRPANSRLDSSLIASDLGIRLRSWRESLPAVVAEIEA